MIFFNTNLSALATEICCVGCEKKSEAAIFFVSTFFAVFAAAWLDIVLGDGSSNLLDEFVAAEEEEEDEEEVVFVFDGESGDLEDT